MRLTVLVDNNTLIDQYLLGEPAVSYYIESEGRKILFDAGYSDVFLLNAAKLGIDLTQLDTVVLSHGHLDHSWGLAHLLRLYSEARATGRMTHNPMLIAHPLVFTQRSYQGDPHIGSLLQPQDLAPFFDIQLSREPVRLTERLTFLGEIERRNGFEAQESLGETHVDGQHAPDWVLDDTALAYCAEDGLVVVTGCSHAGICNITEQARRICAQEKVLDIIGGFHLQNPSEKQMNGTVNYLAQLEPAQVHACHCTDLQSKMVLGRAVNIREVGSGLVLEY
ncbi:MAG: 7,8-dihydropterin-6-yl-methyl-4-(beta-D-ribofuranosyl)aminobenzene 5-phosphate synthase [Chloroflexota bacterium]|nr:7,8-dihydropterin-6-yl-methyl-4-(beta-D-ribofuranosyl)aminobenzene 5-phosphate synthase [Chloroflexota bacterium]